MKLARFFRVGLPLAALFLVWLLAIFRAPDVESDRRSAQAGAVLLPMAETGKQSPESLADWIAAFDASPASADLAVGVALAKERREALKHLIETDPEEALAQSIPAETRVRLPREIADQLERPVSAAGGFELIATCYTGGRLRPTDAEPELQRFVTIGPQRYRAFVFGRRAEMQTKERISLHGIAIDDALAVHPEPVRRLTGAAVEAEAFGQARRFANEEALERYAASLVAYEEAPGPGDGAAGNGDDVPVASSAWTEGAKRILYLRVRFADQDPSYEPISLAAAQSQQADVAEHFGAASYGKMTVTTTFPDVITLSQPKSAYVGQGLGTMMNEARDLAITMGQAQGEDWDYNTHDFYTIVSDGGIGGYAGVAQVGGRKSHLQKGYTSLRTAGHEFGHNFGLLHAYYNYTTDLSPRGSTPKDGQGRVEYGHRFSLMSAQSGSDFDHPLIPHFTAHEKWQLDWLTDADFADITSGNQNGTYRLWQNDEENATGLRALRVPSGGDLSKYWLSYRTAWRTPNRSSDNDYLLNGVVFDWSGSGAGTSTLLDMTPYSDDGSHSGAYWTRDNSDKWDAPLLIGRTYTDPDSRVSVTPITRGGSPPNAYLDVYVHLGTGTEIPLVGETDACRAVVPTAATAGGLDWTTTTYDDSAWPFSGSLGVGYDENSDYLPYFSTDVESAMNNTSESCYVRVPFVIDSSVSLAGIASLKLRMRYDDGFVAYVNGVRVAEANAPASPTWNSGATSSHSDSASIVYAEFSADAALGTLVQGANVLAIHGLNRGTGSSDFLLQPKLDAVLFAEPNDAPSVALAADTLVAGINQDVTLTATASDPDSDTLAYAWDFDIGDTFAPEGQNSAVAVRRWSSAGVYAVTVTCSDRKGGTATDRVVVTVGDPANTASTNGRVLRGGLPVAGARVFIDGTDRQSITLADGSYFFGGLSAVTPVSVGAMLDGEVCQPTAAMPVTAPTTVDFLAHASTVAGAPAAVLTVFPHVASVETGATVPFVAQRWDNTATEDLLVPYGETWKYLDSAMAPAGNWMVGAFDDSGWASGAAELGYGDTQTTVISYGADPANKPITAWFRRQFVLADPTDISRLKLSVKRDDGIRVFLNGTEIARDNLTTGTVSATTEADNDVPGTIENILLHYAVDPALLVAGTNTVAAEVHQVSPDDSDLSFDLELSAARNLSTAAPLWSVTPAGATVSPAGVFAATVAGNYTVTATDGILTDSAVVTVASDNVVTISADRAFLWENGAGTATVRVERSGSTGSALIVPLSVGGDATAGADFQALPASVSIPNGALFTEFAVAVLQDTEAEGRESIHISPQPGQVYALGAGAIASIAIIDDENLRSPLPDAGEDRTVFQNTAIQLDGSSAGSETLIAEGDYWRFDDSGTDRGAGWIPGAFDDSPWKEGLGKFGYGDGNETTTVSYGSNASSKQITTYFRRSFFLADPADVAMLTARLLVDDGAVAYLNGSEILRSNMPGGAIAYATRASNAIGGSDETTFAEWTLDPASLTAGENTFAVEVHQSSPTSSDLGFDLALLGNVTSPPAGTTFLWSLVSGPGTADFSNDTSPTSSVTFDLPGSYVLQLVASFDGESFVDTVAITVDPLPDYGNWIAGFTLSDPSPLADPDGDEWANLMEFATATDPGSAHSSALPDLTRDPASPADLLFSYRRLRALDPAHASGSTGDGYALYGIRYVVEAATDASSWQLAASILTLQQEGAATDNGDGSETVTVRLIPPAGNDTRWFARLNVTLE